nr:MAG TPA: hypothetical protein [Caudoviricetes sp.]
MNVGKVYIFFGEGMSCTPYTEEWLRIEDVDDYFVLRYFCTFSSGVSTTSKKYSFCFVFFLEKSFLSSFMSYPTN